MRRIFNERIGTQTTLRSLELLSTLEADAESAPLLREVGYLYLFDDPAQEADAERVMEYVEELAPGTASLLSADETAREFPWLDPAGLTSSIWSPHDGFLEPMEYAVALTRAGRRHGARLINGVRVEALDASGDGRITSVRTSAGTIAADTVILASGIGSLELARTVGIELPLESHTSQRFLVDQVPQADRPYPFTFDIGSGFAFRGDGPGIMIGFPGEGQVFPSGDHGVEWEDAKANWPRAVKRVPNLAGQQITGGIWGVLDRAPDGYPLIGFHEDSPNLFCFCGFYGSGVMQSLGAGDAAAELLTTGGCSVLDIDVLDANRFRHGNGLPAREFF